MFSFAIFTVTLIVKKTKQNLTLSELLDGKKNERNRKRFKDLWYIINNTSKILYYDTEINITKCYLWFMKNRNTYQMKLT